MQTQLSASPVKIPVHKEQPGGDHGGLTPPYSYSCASPSKAPRASSNQGPPSGPPPTFTHVRQLFKDPLTPTQGMTLTNSSVLDQPGDTG